MLTIDKREITGLGTGAHPGDSASSVRRILVPVRAPAESCPAVAVAAAARICALANGVLCLVHVRACDPPLPIAGRFYLETPGEAAAVLEQALLMAWASGGQRATTAVLDARRGAVAQAIAWQAATWPADLIVLTSRPNHPHPPDLGQHPRPGHAPSQLPPCSPLHPGTAAAIWPATSCQMRRP
jgi:hypothetical protein